MGGGVPTQFHEIEGTHKNFWIYMGGGVPTQFHILGAKEESLAPQTEAKRSRGGDERFN